MTSGKRLMRNRGFTIVELMITLAITSVLALGAITFLASAHQANRLQTALMRRFLKRGGTLERWLECIAPAFRTRYGWLCEQPVLVRTGEHRLPPTPRARHYYR